MNLALCVWHGSHECIINGLELCTCSIDYYLSKWLLHVLCSHLFPSTLGHLNLWESLNINLYIRNFLNIFDHMGVRLFALCYFSGARPGSTLRVCSHSDKWGLFHHVMLLCVLRKWISEMSWCTGTHLSVTMQYIYLNTIGHGRPDFVQYVNTQF